MTTRRLLLVFAVSMIIILTVIVFTLYFLRPGPISQSSTSSVQILPAACKKPTGGYLIVANINGFNDSISHGRQSNPWPMITVSKGDGVKLVVCNSDFQAHGFQIGSYFDSRIESIAPRQAITISFVADKVGTFTMYCSIFCSIHIYMQNGELRVGS